MRMTIDEIRAGLKEIWDSEQNSLKCGGTYSADCLRKSIALLIDLEAYSDTPDYQLLKEDIAKMTAMWREALRRHNEQTSKFVEYNLETGKPK